MPDEPVVYNDHEWVAGDTGENGHLLGPTLLEFFTAWSKVCFQLPRCLWWPKVFKENGGVDWASDEFSDAFRLPATQ